MLSFVSVDFRDLFRMSKVSAFSVVWDEFNTWDNCVLCDTVTKSLLDTCSYAIGQVNEMFVVATATCIFNFSNKVSVGCE